MVQDCLKNVKYRSGWDVIRFLYKLCELPELGDCVVVGVPMWSLKERERGFNQAELIGKLVAESYNVPNYEALERIRMTKPMFGLNIADRKINVSKAFKISNKYTNQLEGERVILVDDVWTTGSTVRECAKVLKMIGVNEVWGVALAW